MLYDKKKYLALLFMIPFALFAIVFLFYPSFFNIYNSFFKFAHKLDAAPVFVGLDNIKWLLNDAAFWRAFLNTGVLIVFVVVFQIGISLVLALFVNSLKKFVTLYRIVFFMPIVVSATAIGLMYLMFIQPDGLFSQLAGKTNVNWLPANNFLALFIVMLPVIWQYIGFYFVIFLTGLSTIPDDILEAAKIDGASTLTTTFKIILPLLWNVFRTCMVLAITGALKVFDLPHIIARDGAPGLQTIFMGTYNNYLYNTQSRLGESAFYSIVIVVVGILVSTLSNTLLRESKDI